MNKEALKEAVDLVAAEIASAKLMATEGVVALEIARANNAALLAILQAMETTEHRDVLDVMAANLRGAAVRAGSEGERKYLEIFLGTLKR